MTKAIDVLVIGAGPAGLAAGASLARYGRRVLILDSRPPGGQARLLGRIENYPGFPEGVSGARLMRLFEAQAKRWGARIEPREVLELERAGPGFLAATASGRVLARAVVLATGSGFRPLGLARERRLGGVLHGGLAEAARLTGRVCVVGGGEAAAYQALAASTSSSRVTLVMRARGLKAHDLLRRRIRGSRRIRVLGGHVPVRLIGRGRLSAVELMAPGGGRRRLKADWLLVLVGKRARRSLVRRARGPGLFYAGEVRLGRHRQVAASAGDGVRAAMDCDRYLNGSR